MVQSQRAIFPPQTCHQYPARNLSPARNQPRTVPPANTRPTRIRNSLGTRCIHCMAQQGPDPPGCGRLGSLPPPPHGTHAVTLSETRLQSSRKRKKDMEPRHMQGTVRKQRDKIHDEIVAEGVEEIFAQSLRGGGGHWVGQRWSATPPPTGNAVVQQNPARVVHPSATCLIISMQYASCTIMCTTDLAWGVTVGISCRNSTQATPAKVKWKVLRRRP